MKIESIHFWGDSIFKGIVFDEIRGRYVILKKSTARLIGEALNLPIINNSLMGRTAPEGLDALIQAQDSMENALVLIEYGGNDCDFDWAEIANEPEREHLPKTTLEQFAKSLKETVDLVRRRGGLPIFCSLPPLDASRYFEWISRGLSKEGILKYLGEVPAIFRWQRDYSDRVEQVARQEGCACLPLRDAFVTYTGDDDLMCIDGIHPNEQGHVLMGKQAINSFLKLNLGLQEHPAALT